MYGNTLLLETSHEQGIVAFSRGEELVCTLPLPVGLRSAAFLFPTLEAGIQQSGMKKESWERIVVSVGPGSFTGIRIGIAAAKGLAASLQIPLWSVSSLYGFVTGGNDLALIDAHNGSAFILKPGGVPEVTRISHPLSENSHTLPREFCLQKGEAVLPEHAPPLSEDQLPSAERRFLQTVCEKCGLTHTVPAENYERILGPHLARFSFPNQEERAPDARALLLHALPAPEGGPFPLYLHTPSYRLG